VIPVGCRRIFTANLPCNILLW